MYKLGWLLALCLVAVGTMGAGSLHEFELADVPGVEEYEAGDLPFLVGDFGLTHSILELNGLPRTDDWVSGIKIIRISPADTLTPTGPCKLYVYVDRVLLLKKRGILLPYDLKLNFKGLSEGTHEHVLLVRMPDNSLGVLNLDLTVKKR